MFVGLFFGDYDHAAGAAGIVVEHVVDAAFVVDAEAVGGHAEFVDEAVVGCFGAFLRELFVPLRCAGAFVGIAESGDVCTVARFLPTVHHVSRQVIAA